MKYDDLMNSVIKSNGDDWIKCPRTVFVEPTIESTDGIWAVDSYLFKNDVNIKLSFIQDERELPHTTKLDKEQDKSLYNKFRLDCKNKNELTQYQVLLTYGNTDVYVWRVIMVDNSHARILLPSYNPKDIYENSISFSRLLAEIDNSRDYYDPNEIYESYKMSE